jgi:hypothetical protein
MIVLSHHPFYPYFFQKIQISQRYSVFFIIQNDFTRRTLSGKHFVKDP